MTAFDGADPITVLYLVSRFVTKCGMKQIAETQTCFINPSFVNRKAVGQFLVARNAFSYTGLHQ